MPTIRVSKENYDYVERMAVKTTTENKKITTIGQQLSMIIELHKKEIAKCEKTMKTRTKKIKT